jgi:hypothetical protein
MAKKEWPSSSVMMGNNTTVANTKDRLGAGKKATTKEGTQ